MEVECWATMTQRTVPPIVLLLLLSFKRHSQSAVAGDDDVLVICIGQHRCVIIVAGLMPERARDWRAIMTSQTLCTRQWTWHICVAMTRPSSTQHSPLGCPSHPLPSLKWLGCWAITSDDGVMWSLESALVSHCRLKRSCSVS